MIMFILIIYALNTEKYSCVMIQSDDEKGLMQ